MSSFNGSTHTSNGAYSAKVRLFVVVAGEHIPLAQVGYNRLYFAEPTLLPAGPAEVVVDVDGVRTSRSVTIPESEAPVRMVECLDR